MKRSPFSVGALVLGFMGAITLHAAAYIGWTEDYNGSEASTLLLWKFDGSSPLQGSATHYTRNASLPSGSSASVGVAAGKWGEALQIGTSDRTLSSSRLISADEGDGGKLALGSIATTVEFWFQPTTLSLNGSYLVTKRTSLPVGAQLRFAGAGTNRLVAEVGNGKGDIQIVTGDLEWNLDTWYHLAMTYSSVSGTLNLYRDGVLIGTKTEAAFGELDIGAAFNWSLGNRAVSLYNAAPGLYDNFRVSDVAYDFAPIPEPTSLAFLGLAALFVIRAGRRAII